MEVVKKDVIMKIDYARVSTTAQNLDMQIETLSRCYSSDGSFLFR